MCVYLALSRVSLLVTLYWIFKCMQGYIYLSMYVFPASFPPVWTHRMHSSDEVFVLSSGNNGLMDNFQRQQSVWNLVQENVPCSELPEIRAALGDALIDTYTELYSEVMRHIYTLDSLVRCNRM